MLTAITYNCNQESIDEIDQVAFSEAFENEVRVPELYRDVAVTVTFHAGKSEITAYSHDNDDQFDTRAEQALRDTFSYFAERAFNAYRAEEIRKDMARSQGR